MSDLVPKDRFSHNEAQVMSTSSTGLPSRTPTLVTKPVQTTGPPILTPPGTQTLPVIIDKSTSSDRKSSETSTNRVGHVTPTQPANHVTPTQPANHVTLTQPANHVTSLPAGRPSTKVSEIVSPTATMRMGSTENFNK